MKQIVRFFGIIFAVFLSFSFPGYNPGNNTTLAAKKGDKINVIVNPYDQVDWSTYTQHKAALHDHTLQSDGYYSVEEVVSTFKKRDFSILAITDHDWDKPNHQVTYGRVPEEKASPYPKDPKPWNFPANTTWPWNDFGGPKPEEAGMLGIEANELTFRHHMNSYFSDYGVWYERTGKEAPYGGITDENGNEIWEDDQLYGIKENDGLAVINHPGISDKYTWWERKPLDWYIRLFKNHSADYLVGIEVTNNTGLSEKYDEGLWDQLLSRFMPGRPIWGFGTNDMHTLVNTQDSYTVFMVDTLSSEKIRDAMMHGQFVFCKSSRRINLLEDDKSIFPTINRIKVNEKRGTIKIKASNYDKIVWISAPESSEILEDYKINDHPWPSGRLVHVGETLNYRNSDNIKGYVRAELIRMENDQVFRTFTNPFGIGFQN